MKKGGFTIVELIVSIALIAMLSTILTVVIVKKMRSVKDTTYSFLIESIEVAAEEYATNNEALLMSYAENDWVKIPLSTLIEKNYFEEFLINPKTKKELPITDFVYVTRSFKGKIESYYNINQNTSPTITLNGKFNIYIKLNSTFVDPGVTAFDSDGNDVSNLVTKTGVVDTTQNGDYVISYKYQTTTITRNVIVGDKKIDGVAWYTLTINPSNGYFNGSNETTIYNLKEGRNQDLTNITKEGSEFVRWDYTCTGCNVTNGIFTMGTSNATVTAVWNPLPQLVVNLVGGTTTQVFSTYYHPGDQIELLTPYKTGASFKFWSFVGEGSILNGSTFTIGSSNATITANWLVYNEMYTYTGSSAVVDDVNGNWRIKFLTSGTLTPLVDMSIDAFLVGGGGAGGRSADNGLKCGGGGGAGGYTGTYTLNLTANTPYTIVIGAGGIHSTANSGYGGTGGTTSAFGYSKAGGTGGYGYIGSTGPHAGGTGGSNGGTGRTGTGYDGYSYGSTAQGSTTCEFGEGTTTSCTNGVSYAYAGGGGGGGGNGGGGGAAGIAGAGAGAGVGGCGGGYGTANTGGGGGGAYSKGICYGGDGGSGIVIIRNHR